MVPMVLKPIALAFAAVITAQPLVNEDVLEPSVENEVAHALACATRLPPSAVTNIAANVAFAEYYATNGLSANEKAIKLVSEQRSDGRWFVGTNEVTWAAMKVLYEITVSE